MAYLHCHNCNWSQDDFWEFRVNWKNIFRWKYRTFGYNPLSLLLAYTAEYIKPRYINMDPIWAREYGYKSNDIFSWSLLYFNIKRLIKNVCNMKWMTEKSFKRDYKNNIANCPNCYRSDNFDID